MVQDVVEVQVDPRAIDMQPGPEVILEGLRARREELREQLEQLEDRREDATERITELRNQGLDYSGVESRIKGLDEQIAGLDQAIRLADADVARASAVPGAIVPEPPPPPRDGPPEEVWVLSGLMIMFVFFPLAVAYARRLWKRPVAPAALTVELGERLRGIEQSVESVAVEMERIGEGQRFMSRLFSEREGRKLVEEKVER